MSERNRHTAAVVTVVDDETFASKAEATCWRNLQLRLAAGEIEQLTRQPEFILDEPRTVWRKHERKISYTADFRYLDRQTGRWTVVEVKGRRFRDYPVRRRWFLQRYGELYDFFEIDSDDLRERRRRAA